MPAIQLKRLLSICALCIPGLCLGSPQVPESAAAPAYDIVISKANWFPLYSYQYGLEFSFSVKNDDGSAIKFANPDKAVTVCDWTESMFDATIDHFAETSYDPYDQTWHVILPGIDPRQKIVHVQFDVRDPASRPSQSRRLDTNVRFSGVPFPKSSDTLEPLTNTTTTQWGTVVTLKSLELKSTSGYSQPVTQFEVSTIHQPTPDDFVTVNVTAAYDNGQQIPGLMSKWGSGTGNGEDWTLAADYITPGLYPTLDLDLMVIEQAFSPSVSVPWKTMETDIPLDGIASPKARSGVMEGGSKTKGNVKYHIQLISDQSFSKGVLIWTKTPAVGEYCRVTNVTWTKTQAANKNEYDPPIEVTNDAYWHTDGAPVTDGEYGAFIPLPQPYRHLSFPLQFTSHLVKHGQQTVEFSNIPAPANGQKLVLRQTPDALPQSGLRLKSISWNVPDENDRTLNPQRPSPAYSYKLIFGYTDIDGSLLSLAPINVKDESNDEICDKDLTGIPAAPDFTSVNPSQRTFTLTIPLPPHYSKSIDVKAILTKETPTEPAQYFSVDSSGNLTILDSPLPDPYPADSDSVH